MSICNLNKKRLDAYILGDGKLEEFDHLHSRYCPRCQRELDRALYLRKMLKEYFQALDTEATLLLEADAPEEPAGRFHRPKRRLMWKSLAPWIATAASLLLAALLGVQLLQTPESPPLESAYLGSLESASARLEILNYLRQAQLFLLSLFDEAASCEESQWLTDERVLARKLIYRKHLLEPKLEDLSLEDIGPLLDEIELLLTDVANSKNCAEINLWRQVMEARSTLKRINLLQMEGRI